MTTNSQIDASNSYNYSNRPLHLFFLCFCGSQCDRKSCQSVNATLTHKVKVKERLSSASIPYEKASNPKLKMILLCSFDYSMLQIWQFLDQTKHYDKNVSHEIYSNRLHLLFVWLYIS